jgi:predicted nucleic acid-binding protein
MRRQPDALRRLQTYRPGDVVLCSPVAAEVSYGLERLPDSRRRRNLEREYARLRDAVRWQDWDEEAASEFGRQKARLETAGTPLEDMDIAIGAIAVRLGCRLATYNAKHMSRLHSLDVDDWSQPI